jgi:hypothetical protein
VTVHASKTVGPYQVDIVSSTDAGGLKKWLVDNKYRVPKGSEPMLEQYVKEKWLLRWLLGAGDQSTISAASITSRNGKPPATASCIDW